MADEASKTIEESKPASGKKVIVYSTPTCPYCHMVKEFLKEKGVEFEDVNVAEDQERAKHMIEKSGQQGVPVVEIGEKIIVGFQKDAIAKELGLE